MISFLRRTRLFVSFDTRVRFSEFVKLFERRNEDARQLIARNIFKCIRCFVNGLEDRRVEDNR